MPARPEKKSVLAAARAGLRSAMYQLGHQPFRDFPSLVNEGDSISFTCSVCGVPVTAVIDYDAGRVSLEGPCFQQRCQP